ncbi:MAG: hypothetical protein ACI89X_001360 [Planctomycetota bacterium]
MPYSSGDRGSVVDELFDRPQPSVVNDLIALLTHQDIDLRCSACGAFGELLAGEEASGLDPELRKSGDGALHALLADAEERIRASALAGHAGDWMRRSPRSVSAVSATGGVVSSPVDDQIHPAMMTATSKRENPIVRDSVPSCG